MSYKFKNREKLDEAIELWCDNKDEALNIYGDINTWDVSNINDMSKLFFDKQNFNDNIKNWDVSNVTSMELMFYHAISFNQKIGKWNVRNVTNMIGMFFHAFNFNQDIGNWRSLRLRRWGC